MDIKTRIIAKEIERAKELIREGYVVSTSNHNRNNSEVRFHTDPDCYLLEHIESDFRAMTEEYARERNMEECKHCAGECERDGSYPEKNANYWRNKSPEDIFG